MDYKVCQHRSKKCLFYKDGKCVFSCSVVVPECSGCVYIDESQYCSVYAQPDKMFLGGRKCPMYLSNTDAKKQEDSEVFINPLKASKRRARGRK